MKKCCGKIILILLVMLVLSNYNYANNVDSFIINKINEYKEKEGLLDIIDDKTNVVNMTFEEAEEKNKIRYSKMRDGAFGKDFDAFIEYVNYDYLIKQGIKFENVNQWFLENDGYYYPYIDGYVKYLTYYYPKTITKNIDNKLIVAKLFEIPNNLGKFYRYISYGYTFTKNGDPIEEPISYIYDNNIPNSNLICEITFNNDKKYSTGWDDKGNRIFEICNN